MAPKRKSIKDAIDDVESAFEPKKIMKRPMSQSLVEVGDPVKNDEQEPPNAKRVKERWIERNWKGLSKEFQQAWEASCKEKDPTCKDKLMSVIVKGGKAARNYELDAENLQEAVKEVRSKTMRSSTKSYSRSFMVGKLGSESAFEKALAAGEIVEVTAPQGSQVPYYSYMSFELAEQTAQEESFGLNRRKGSIGKSEMKEVEQLLMNAGCWFQSKPKGSSSSVGSSPVGWTQEATNAVQKAIQTGNQLIEKLLVKLKTMGNNKAPTTMVKETMTNSKCCVGQIQDFIAKLQMVVLEKSMDEGKEMMGAYVKKTKEAMQMLDIVETLS